MTEEYMDSDGVHFVLDNNQFMETNLCESTETNYENVVYADGSQAILVHNGQYFIPTDKTIVLEDGEETINPLVINDAEESQLESVQENVIQYIQETDENGEQVVYEISNEDTLQLLQNQCILSDVESETVVENTSSKNSEVDETEQIFESDYQIELLNNSNVMVDESGLENSDSSGKYQYAILNDGKLHLQIVNDNMVLDENSQTSRGEVEVDAELHRQLTAFENSITMKNEDLIDIKNIVGKNVVTGQVVTLENYFNKDLYKTQNSKSNISNILNKKISIGTTAKGKKLIGKIIEIKTNQQKELSIKENHQIENNKSLTTQELLMTLSDEAQMVNYQDNSHLQETESLAIENLETSLNQRKKSPTHNIIVEQNPTFTEKNFNFISKTLIGLMEMESVQKKIVNKKLMIKLVEKEYMQSLNAYSRNVCYVFGHMEFMESLGWSFILDSDDVLKDNGENSADKMVCLDGAESVIYAEENILNSSEVVLDEERMNKAENGMDSEKSGIKEEDGEEVNNVERSTTEGTMIKSKSDVDNTLNKTNEYSLIKQTEGTILDFSEQNSNSGSQTKNFNETMMITIILSISKGGTPSTRVKLLPTSEIPICKECNKIFRSSSHLKKHIIAHHSNNDTFFCNICGFKFDNIQNLNKHKKVHGTTVACDICKRTFNSYNSLKRHLTIHDKSLRHLVCAVCSARFTDTYTLKKHLMIHTGIRAFSCDKCDRSFVSQSDLKMHQRTHDPVKLYVCRTCNREFSRYSNLLRHEEIHRGAGNLFQCDICGCSYNYISSLTRHMVQNHINQKTST